MKQILIKLSDGRLAYCRPAASPKTGETEDAFLERIGRVTIEKATLAKCPGYDGAIVVAFVDEEVVLQADREFRDAWDWTTLEPKMDYDFEKCRQIVAKRAGVSVSDPRIANARTIAQLKDALK